MTIAIKSNDMYISENAKMPNFLIIISSYVEILILPVWHSSSNDKYLLKETISSNSDITSIVSFLVNI